MNDGILAFNIEGKIIHKNNPAVVEFYLNGEDLNYQLSKVDNGAPSPELPENTSKLMIGANTINLSQDKQDIYNKQINNKKKRKK